jgi:hypothetical protein
MHKVRYVIMVPTVVEEPTTLSSDDAVTGLGRHCADRFPAVESKHPRSAGPYKAMLLESVILKEEPLVDMEELVSPAVA